MLKVQVLDREGDLIAEIETQEGVIPRKGETVRIEWEGEAAGDYQVEFVRWNLSEDGPSVQLLVEPVGKVDLWPEGATRDNVRVLFKDAPAEDDGVEGD